LTAKNLGAAFVISRVSGAKKRTQQALAKPVERATLLAWNDTIDREFSPDKGENDGERQTEAQDQHRARS
jgi:hypothetical protein